MRKRAGRAAELGNYTKQRAADRVLERLVTATPVDTSRALSNWQASLAGPVPAPIEPYVWGSHASSETASTAVALRIGSSTIERSSPGQDITLSNVVPYIRELAYENKSMQGPAGWVERAVEIGRRQGMQEAAAKRNL